MSATPQHETVGWRFKAGGAIYRCTRYERRAGFWMRLIEGEDTMVNRVVGDEACVSERAIGAAYHRIYRDEAPAAHEQPCECYVCHGDEARS